MPIAKNVFQTAKNFEDLNEEYKQNILALQDKNPNWRYQFFDDAEVRNYIQEHVTVEQWSLVQDINPKYGVVLADIFRYLVIYNEGGVYLDIKSTAKRPLNEVIPSHASFLLSQWPNKIGQRFVSFGLHADLVCVPGGEFQQWHVIGEKGHPFLKAVLELVFRNLREYTPKRFGTDAYGVLRVSGPIAYTKAIFPLLDLCPHTIVETDALGIFYSIYEETGDIQRHEKHPTHYSRVREPIVLKDVYVERPVLRVQSLGEILAQEVRENTDLILKIAVFAIFSTLTVVLLLPFLLLWIMN